MASNKNKTSKNIKIIGGIVILISPLVFAFSLPITEHLCSTNALQCGYLNLGSINYAIYFGLVPLIIGVLVFFVGLVLGFKKHI
jgi:hypothetical protein